MFWFAVSFLTRLPVPERTHQASAETLARAPLCFPLVGALIGLGTGLLALLLARVLPAPLAILIALAVEARATGAMHEDALADAADALGGGWSREDVLRILKDSRLGTYGTLALVFGVGLRYVAMVSLPPERFLGAVVLAAAGGRLVMLYLLAMLPPIPERRSLSGDLGGGITRAGRLLAGMALVPAALWLLRALPATQLLILLALAILCCAGFLRWYRSYLDARLGGSTGDLLGTSSFVGQLIVLIVLSMQL